MDITSLLFIYFIIISLFPLFHNNPLIVTSYHRLLSYYRLSNLSPSLCLCHFIKKLTITNRVVEQHTNWKITLLLYYLKTCFMPHTILIKFLLMDLINIKLTIRIKVIPPINPSYFSFHHQNIVKVQQCVSL